MCRGRAARLQRLFLVRNRTETWREMRNAHSIRLLAMLPWAWEGPDPAQTPVLPARGCKAQLLLSPPMKVCTHMHTQLEPMASSDSWFVFSFVAKASQDPGSLSKPHAMPGNSWHPCLAALIPVGAGAPAPACRLRPHGCHSPRHCHWRPRRHLQDVQQGGADNESFMRIKASPPWQSPQPQ